MHVIAALFSTAKRWRHLSVHWQMNQQTKCCAHAYIEYYSTLKKKEKKILTHATTQMNLEKIKLSEISQSQRTNTE